MKLSDEIKIQAALELGQKRLIPFMQLCDENYEPGAFHYSLARQMEQVFNRVNRRVIICTPPQHGKSRIVAMDFPAWVLGKDPTARIVVASYGSDLAKRNSLAARTLVEENEIYKAVFPETKITNYKRAIDHWQTTAGGYYKGVGVGGGLTGFGCDILIVDDPFKDWTEANSAARRETVWNWFLTVAMTRLHPEGVVIIINTRWHMNDLCGNLLSPERIKLLEAQLGRQEVYKEIKYRAISRGENDDPLGREAGETLWPERYNKDYLEATKANLPAKHWASLYDQEPIPQAGNLINPAWLNKINEDQVPAGLRWFRFWDLATTVKKTSDYTASVACAIDGQGNFYIKDGVFGKWEWPKVRNRIVEIAESEKAIVRTVGIEAVGGFKSAFQNLKEDWISEVSLKEVNVDKDKVLRSDTWTPVAENGKLFMVHGSWVSECEAQCVSFPEGGYDDFVDAISGAYALCKQGNAYAVPVSDGRGKGFGTRERKVFV